MTFVEAVRTLRSGGSWPVLGEAIAVVLQSPESSLLDVALGLKHGGVIAEQAALALYKRTDRLLPDDRRQLVTDIRTWTKWIIRGAADDPVWSATAADRIKEGSENANANKERLVTVRKEDLVQFLSRELSRTERLVLTLYYYENMTFKEIAAVMDLTESQVVELHQAILKRVREHLGAGTEPLSRLVRDLVA